MRRIVKLVLVIYLAQALGGVIAGAYVGLTHGPEVIATVKKLAAR